MGFITGFTGGVTLTLSIAYLSALAHQRRREQQGHSLRAQALAVQSFIDPIPQPLPPTRSEVAAARRAEAVEIAKERWNDEVESAVKWVQRIDWREIRETWEDRIAGIWARAFGESIQDSTTRAQAEAAAGAHKAKVNAADVASTIASRARGGFSRAQTEADDLGAKVKDKALQARLAAWREAKRVENEARKTAKSALEKGKDKAAEVVDQVKNAVGLTGAAAPGHIDLLALNPVQKALDQRFERFDGDERTIADILKQRYVPVDSRDNTVLRGI